MSTETAWRRDLTLLVVGNGVSSFGNAVYLVAMVLFLKELVDSAFIIGAFQFLALIPGLLISPMSGALIDRWSRKRILIVTDAIRGVLMLLVGVAFLVPRVQSAALVLALALGAGIGHAFFVPAAQAIIPELVPPRRLSAANSLRAGGSQIFNMVGSAVGGVIYALFGAPFVLILNGGTFLISALQETWIVGGRRGEVDATESGIHGSGGLFAAVGETVVILREDTEVRRRILSQALMFLLSPVFLLALPFVLIDRLGMGEETLGYLFAVSLFGGIVTFTVLSRIPIHRLVAIPLPTVAYTVFAALFGALALSPSIGVLLVGAFIAGSAAAAVYLSATVYIQSRVDTRSHGRLFAVMEAASAGVAPISYLATGAAIDALGISGIGTLFGVAGGLAGVWAAILTMRARRGR